MLNFYPNPSLIAAARGRLTFFENGRDVGLRLAYPLASLIGLRLQVPRLLGTAAVCLQLTRDGEEEPALFSLRYCGGEGGGEQYAVLIDGATLADGGCLFFGRLAFDTIYGRLFAVCRADGSLTFTREGSAAAFPLLLTAAASPVPGTLLGGAIYALPLRELGRLGRLFRGEDDDYAGFFSHLAALGVRALWLSPPAGEETEGARWSPSQLPRAFLSSAEKNGIRLLFDLLCCSGVRDEGGFVPYTGAGAPAAPGEVMDDRPGFWNTPTLPEQASATSVQDYFCGKTGVLARARQAGGGGFFLRGAGRFGDAWLTMLRTEMGEGVFLGTAESDPAPIHFGVRRRYLFGGALDGIASSELREACFSYLVEGKTEGLAHYLGRTLPATPAAALCLQPEGLSTYESGSFLSALTEAFYEQEAAGRADSPYALAELAHLIAGTLPGLPLYLAGEENGLPYPPTQGEAVGGQLAFFLRLAQLRRKEPVYRDGGFRLLHLSPSLLVFSREREGEALLTVINRSPGRLSLASPDGFSVVFGGRGLKNVFPVRPYGGIVLKVSSWEGERCRLRFTCEAPEEAASITLPRVSRVTCLARRR